MTVVFALLFSSQPLHSSLSLSHLDIRDDCPKPSETRFDAVFTDLFGMWQVRSLVGMHLQDYR